MITDEGKYYLYRHIRLDKNQVFYIGIGTKDYIHTHRVNPLREFKRAYDKGTRTKFWNRIINKTEYRVEVIFQSNDYDWIQEKEVEFISLYGRRYDGSGTLTNYELGGRSSTGYKYSEEQINKARERAKKQIGQSG